VKQLRRFKTVRPFVVGRRNWLFCDTVAGAQASAHLYYSLIETCKANSIEPYAYLVELFRQLPLATRRANNCIINFVMVNKNQTPV
jgi:hypothetical protein